jgi:hypothetical protein
MPFPFLWIGALVAAAFLTFMFLVFGVLMKLLNRATTDVRGSILPGLIEGIRDWADDHGLPPIRMVSPRSDEDEPSVHEPPTPLRLEHVRRAR